MDEKMYSNLSGSSNVFSFELGLKYIKVKFKTGVIQEYTYNTASKKEIEQMKGLAVKGEGLGRFIDKNKPNRVKKSEDF